MNVLSLFDGISCGYIALQRAGIKVDRYVAYEIDETAIAISRKHFPEIEHRGSVVGADFTEFQGFDIVLAGFPCQDLSINKANREGLKGARSGLFWELARALQEVKPKYFLVENNYKMPEEDEKTITETLGVPPNLLNSALLSAQNRLRDYWVNFVINGQPEDRGIIVADIVEHVKAEDLAGITKFNEKVYVESPQTKPLRVGTIGKGGQGERVYSIHGKTVTLTANGGGRGAKTGLYYIDGTVRKLTPLEAERAQTLPDNYTALEGISNTQRFKCIGNGWTVDVIAWILSHLPEGGSDEWMY